MLAILLLTFSLGAFADESVTMSAEPATANGVICMAALASKPAETPKLSRFSSGALIKGLLEERGKALKATNIGLIETQMKNGETMISAVHFTTDGSPPVPEHVVNNLLSRLSRRVHQLERVNVWELNLVGGGIVIRSLPK